MIIWLASYPKSGNTLLRSILSAYFFSKDGNFDFEQLKNIKTFPRIGFFKDLGIDTNNENEIFKNYINAQKNINFGNERKIIFLKTHSSYCKINNFPFTDSKNTLGAIYVVRDPRNIVNSLSNHFSNSISDATNNLLGEMYQIEEGTKCRTHIGKWNFHYNSWKNFPKKNFLFIKYEDLIINKKDILRKILNFLEILTKSKFPIDNTKIQKVISTTEFNHMKKMENKKGFHEASINTTTGKVNNFFNLGPNNDWKKLLNTELKEKIEKNYKKEMIELGYIKN